MDKLVLIMARKNSKRIKDKNMKLFMGEPLIKWSLEIAKKLEIKTVISTDHEQIKKLVNSWYPGFIVIDQPEEIQEEKSNNNKSMKYIIDIFKPKIIILLQPTSPLRDWTLLQNWIKQFENSNYNSGFSVIENNKYFYDESGEPVYNTDRLKNNPDKPKLYSENGSFYIFRTSTLENNHIVYGKKMLFIDQIDIDLDTEKDWLKWESIIKGGYFEN